MVHLDNPQLLSLAVGVVLPLLVGLVTKLNTAPAVRAVLLLVLAAATAFLAELVDTLNNDTAFDAGATLVTVIGTFLVGVGTHFGLWKPTGTATTMQAVGSDDRAPTAGG